MNLENANKKILILGAGGFIGTNLSRRLICDGRKLVLFDRPGVSFSAIQSLAMERGICEIETIFDALSAFGDTSKADAYLSGIDTVYHLISTTCPTNSNTNIAEELQSNVIDTVKLLDGCVRNKVSKVVFLSSGGTVYGKNHEGLLSESAEEYPISSYGVQKLTIEKILYLYNEMYGLDYRIIRLSNPFGPYQNPNGVQGVVAAFTWKALNNQEITIYGDGSVIRDYIYIDDAINGIINITSDSATHKLYNLGSGVGTSVSEILEIVKRVVNSEVNVSKTPGRAVDVPKNVLDITRYSSEFGNPVIVDLESGIKKLADFYLERK